MKDINIIKIKEIFRDSYHEMSFVKSKISGSTDPSLKHIVLKLVELKAGLRFQWVYSYKTKDITKNFTLEETTEELAKILTNDFRNISILLKNRTYQYDPVKEIIRTVEKGNQSSTLSHDRQKNFKVNADADYLFELGITSSNKLVKKDRQSKFKQINKYIEIVEPLIEAINQQDKIQIRDMGSGKGYLSFALYNYLIQKGLDIEMTGIEARPDIVSKCNTIADKLKFNNLTFEEGYISDYPMHPTDILIALHACDTATDDAIAYGIKSQSQLIICSPCCHKQVRKSMSSDSSILAINKHGILKERQAEIVTDSIRALLLEHHGYSTKIMEFISSAHTPKNLLIVGIKKTDSLNNTKLKEVESLKKQFGIKEHYLEKLVTQ